MSGSPPYVIDLCEAERWMLPRRARSYSAPYAEVVRAKIVLLAADGWANVDIKPWQSLAERLIAYEDRDNLTARPFDWTFTRADLLGLCRRIDAHNRTSPVTLAA